MTCSTVGRFIVSGERYTAPCELDAEHAGQHEHHVKTTDTRFTAGPDATLAILRWEGPVT